MKKILITESERNSILSMYKNIDITTKIKLTESDLKKTVKKVLKEDPAPLPNMENVSLGKVKAVQQALVNAGYYIGNTGDNEDGVDGIFGKNTRAAVIKYQRDNGIKQTGNVGPITSGKLGVSPLTSGKPSQPQTKKTEKPLQPQTKKTEKPLQPQTKKAETPKVSIKPHEKSVNTSGDYLMIIAFPQYEPKVDKGETVSWLEKGAIMTQTGEYPKEGTYGKIGHAGVAIISQSGFVKLFEFGRYQTKIGQGRVISKNLGKIAKINSSGEFTNYNEVAKIVKSNTQGDGPRLNMITAVVILPNIQKAKAFAEGPAIREYEAVDMSQGGAANCGTFAIDTARAGGVPIGDFCTPMPVKMIANFKQFSTHYFNV